MSDLRIEPFARVASGIKGLDLVLNGGFLAGGVYLLMGPPGAGKTILANQLSFNHAAQGGRSLYITLLAETHGRMMGNIHKFKFFKEEAVADSIHYLGAYATLERDGLTGLIRSLGEAIRKFKATMLFIDGIASAEETANSSLAFKKFVHQLNSVMSTSSCTTFLLSSLDGGISHPEHTMVDGIVSLRMQESGMDSIRTVEVKKFRGSNHFSGLHPFRITSEGLKVFPRVESYIGRDCPQPSGPEHRVELGVKGLDEMLEGGVYTNSVTALLGPAGVGKSTIGCRFLERGCESGEAALYFGFYEAPNRLTSKMERLGIKLNALVESGKLEIIWVPSLDHTIDEMADQLLAAVRRRGVKRLFIDGLGGLRSSMHAPDRVDTAMAAIGHELRALGVTTVFTEELDLFTTEIRSKLSDSSPITDNIFLLRQVEVDCQMRSILTILKSRENGSDRRIHEFRITPRGPEVGAALSNLNGLISGNQSNLVAASEPK